MFDCAHSITWINLSLSLKGSGGGASHIGCGCNGSDADNHFGSCWHLLPFPDANCNANQIRTKLRGLWKRRSPWLSIFWQWRSLRHSGWRYKVGYQDIGRGVGSSSDQGGRAGNIYWTIFLVYVGWFSWTVFFAILFPTLADASDGPLEELLWDGLGRKMMAWGRLQTCQPRSACGGLPSSFPHWYWAMIVMLCQSRWRRRGDLGRTQVVLGTACVRAARWLALGLIPGEGLLQGVW